ncbi:MAG: hypothetical protein ACI8Z1_000937 [Candidatus Azotimanducaceae bacterium]|jgi:hypothetical protein
MSSQCPLTLKNCRYVLMLLLVWGGLPRPVLAATTEGIGAGQLLFITHGQAGDKASHHPKANRALHLNSSAEFRINGLIAHVTLEQTFRNDSAEWREGVYVLPMHELAAVNEMEMRIGERIVRAQIKEKLEARKIYQVANAAGKKAALVEQSRPNMFQQAVANIAPASQSSFD